MKPIERRIPDNVGGTETLFDSAPLVGTVEFNDGLVAFGPALAILFISQNILPSEMSTVSLVLTGITAMFGVALLFIKPRYLTLSEWARNIYDFRQREKDLARNLVTDGGRPIDSIELAPDNDTRRVIGVRELHPNHDSIERTDGAMVSAIRFTGANMDTADQAAWSGAVSRFANFANTQLRNDVQLYLPMREFDPTQQVNMYSERLQDEDIRGNPVMQSYLQDRVAWMGTVGSSSYVREYYAIVTVTRREVFDSAVNNQGGAGSLDKLPGGRYIKDFLIGLGVIGSDARTMSKRELQAKQLRELERRREDISKTMAVGPGNDGHIVPVNDLGVLLKEFWEGKTLHEAESNGIVRERPFVVGEYDKQQAQQAENPMQNRTTNADNANTGDH